VSGASFYKQNTLPDSLKNEEGTSPIPQTIGPYKIDSLLNKGGMSLLYLGVDPETKLALAVKVLSPAYVNQHDAIERFSKEAKIIGLSNHPNIVKLFGHGEWAGGLYIAMELIRGISLHQFITQQSLSLKRTLDIILQVSYALHHLHSHGVVHRDLKPENILITEDGEIKVIDFGIAMLHTERGTGTKRTMGTPHYMSPEQKENPMDVTFATDIYALGIITYELVLGKLSYGIVNLSFLPKGLRKIIEKALAVSLKERYPDTTEFISDITSYMTSGAWEKERSGTDQTKELFETIQEAAQSLSPLDPPQWPQVELGMAKFKNMSQMGLYYDFFHFPDDTYGIFLSLTSSSEVDGAVYSGVLCGQVRAYLEGRKEAPSPSDLVTTLSSLHSKSAIEQQFALHFLILDPIHDRLKFCTAGLGSIFHVPSGGIPRPLTSSNPPIGKVSAELTTTEDSWNIGDTLILNTFHTQFTEQDEPPILSEAIKEHIALSTKAQADSILKKLMQHPHFSSPHPKLLLSLQRIS
jgi:eukaryotic-like serine/threonine-protein kinase